MTGDAAAVYALLTRDYAIGDLLARAAAAAGADVTECVALAWEQLIADAASGSGTERAQTALLERVILVLDQRQQLDTADTGVPERSRFLPPGDRWAGWWPDNEPPAWPPDAALPREQVIRALRQLRLRQRVLLVLRDAARMSPEEAGQIVNEPEPHQTALLDEARQAYVAAIDQQVADQTDREGDPAVMAEGADRTDGRGKAVTGLRASDVSCDVIVGLIGRWLDGGMDYQDRDAYEQHLLFCPACARQLDKTRRALTALSDAAAGAPDDVLRRRLSAVVRPGS